MNLNKVLLIGNLTRDPELRYVNEGSAVCDMRLAVNRRFRRNDGEMSEETCFIDVVVWGKQAENCSQYLKKGRAVLVEGRLKFDSWQTQDGQKRSKHSVVGERVQFMPRSGGGGAPAEDEVQSYGSNYNADPKAAAGPAEGDAAPYDDSVPF